MTDTVKLLSDDALREIEARLKSWAAHEIPHTQYPASWSEVNALCATVRALRERLDKLNTLGEEMLTRLEKVAGVGMKADHGWYFVVGEVERQHTALREQLAQYDRERQELWFFLTRRPASQLSHEELIAIHRDMANERDELKDQLAQVTQERDSRAVTSETLVREWANFHPDIPLTKTYRDLVQRVQALRGCPHCVCVCVDCAPCGEEQP